MTQVADTTAGRNAATDERPVMVFSSDNHVGPRLKEDLRQYCPEKYLAAFDDYANSPMGDAVRNRVINEPAYSDAYIHGRSRNLETRRSLRRRDLRSGHGPRGDLGGGDLPPEPQRTAVPVGRHELVRSGHSQRRHARARRRRPSDLQPLARRLLLGRARNGSSDSPNCPSGTSTPRSTNSNGARTTASTASTSRSRDLRHGATARRRDGRILCRGSRARHDAHDPHRSRASSAPGAAPRPEQGLTNMSFGLVDSLAWGLRTAYMLCMFGTFEKHPNLKLVITEIPGVSWSAMARNMDSVHYTPVRSQGREVLPRPPSEYLASNVWLGSSFQSRQEAIDAIDCGAADRFIWGSDYPHPEGTFSYSDDPDRASMTPLAARLHVPRPAARPGAQDDRRERGSTCTRGSTGPRSTRWPSGSGCPSTNS